MTQRQSLYRYLTLALALLCFALALGFSAADAQLYFWISLNAAALSMLSFGLSICSIALSQGRIRVNSIIATMIALCCIPDFLGEIRRAISEWPQQKLVNETCRLSKSCANVQLLGNEQAGQFLLACGTRFEIDRIGGAIELLRKHMSLLCQMEQSWAKVQIAARSCGKRVSSNNRMSNVKRIEFNIVTLDCAYCSCAHPIVQECYAFKRYKEAPFSTSDKRVGTFGVTSAVPWPQSVHE